MVRGYRVWDKKHNTYFELSGLHYEGGKIDGIFAISGTLAGIPNVIFLEPEDVVLEQDTGLRDKNGEKIYEGDIVEANYFESHYAALDVGKTKQITGCIHFGSGCFYISSMSDETPLFQSGGSDNIEVIGNIHEHPELLGSEE